MRISRSALALLLFTLQSAVAQTNSALKIDPSCPVTAAGDEETREIQLAYDPTNPGALLRDPQKLVLEVGVNGKYWGPDNTRAVPFVRNNDGLWRATLKHQNERDVWFYLMFEVKDEASAKIDDNHGQYWDAVACNPGGGRNSSGVEEQARSYTGFRFDNGIGRSLDYGKAIAVLESQIKTFDDYNVLRDYWDYKVRRDGKNEAAWQKISLEIRQFIDDHSAEEFALVGAFNFVQSAGDRLPPDLYPKLMHELEAVNPAEAVRCDRMATLNRIHHEKNTGKQAEMLANFVHKYPNDPEAANAAAERFADLRELHDVKDAESMFPQLMQFDPNWADTYAAMAAIYLENDQKAEEALNLLAKAEKLGPVDFGGHPAFHMTSVWSTDNSQNQAVLAYWRARAYLLLGKPELALPLAQKAVEQRQSSATYYVLAQAWEAAGEKQKALDAYLEALARPSRENPEQTQRLKHLWVSSGLGSTNQIDDKIHAWQEEAFRRANYVPRLIARPVPDYEFTTLKGEKFRAADLRNKTVILNFWGVWCSPCLPELPGFQELQQKHPELVVAALAISSDRKEIDRLIKQEALETLRIANADSFSDAFVPQGVPVTYVIDQGRIRVVHQQVLNNVVAYIEADLAAMKASATQASASATR
jgi:thiol-disulfide isomerase/thioredoxin